MNARMKHLARLTSDTFDHHVRKNGKADPHRLLGRMVRALPCDGLRLGRVCL